jgi:hypothetical protein
MRPIDNRDAVEKREFFPCLESNPNYSIVQPVTRHYIYWGILFDILVFPQWVRIFHAFYGTRKFSTISTRTYQCALKWAGWILVHILPSDVFVAYFLFSHLLLSLQSGLFRPFNQTFICPCYISRAPYLNTYSYVLRHTSLFLLDFVSWILFEEEYKLLVWSSSLGVCVIFSNPL